ncbi:MAG: hypothetical protein AAF500_12580 [Myxococcota bacterium]
MKAGRKFWFTDPFLKNAYDSLLARRKSFSHRGKISFDTEPSDDYEWLTVVFQATNRLVLVLQMIEGNRADIFIRSNNAKDRGKIVARIEDLFLVDNGAELTRAVDATITLIRLADSHEDVSRAAIEKAWDRVMIGATPKC